MNLSIKNVDVRNHPEFENHERIVRASHEETGFVAFIGIHDTSLGPAMGGCRYWPNYKNEDEALTDVLRLSQGMSYKNALAGLPFGGGKTVIVGRPGETEPSDDDLQLLGLTLEALNGQYITAEDVGVKVRHMQELAKHTSHVRGLPLEDPSVTSGDPSPYTARGVYEGIKAAVKVKLGKDNLTGVKIAVSGLGLGMTLCEMLHKDKAELYVSDINDDKLKEAISRFGATPIDPDAFIEQKVDVLAPCALGAVISDDTIDKINAQIIAGSANNQLHQDHHGQMLHDRGILYAPDHVISAGGVLSIGLNGRPISETHQRLQMLGQTLESIFVKSLKTDTPTSEIADSLAEEILLKAEENGTNNLLDVRARDPSF